MPTTIYGVVTHKTLKAFAIKPFDVHANLLNGFLFCKSREAEQQKKCSFPTMLTIASVHSSLTTLMCIVSFCCAGRIVSVIHETDLKLEPQIEPKIYMLIKKLVTITTGAASKPISSADSLAEL